MKTITTEELKKKLEANKNIFLVDVLMPNSFKARHIPGAKNAPYSLDFMNKLQKTIQAPKDAEIIVYCASEGCQLSIMAAESLEKAGYTKVAHYAKGLAGWQDAGYKFEGESV